MNRNPVRWFAAPRSALIKRLDRVPHLRLGPV